MRHLRLDEPRTHVVAALRAEPSGLDASELGRRVGLHANTVRWHLGILEDARIVTSHREERSTPGRPRILYRLDPGEATGGRDEYRLLATVLAETVSRSGGGSDASEATGRTWGADLVGGRRDAGGDPVGEVV